MLETFRQDLRHAARSLRRTPGFTATAVLTLALGVGATSAIFTVLNAALLKPLPYPDGGRLVVLGTSQFSSQPGQLFLYLRDRTRTAERVAAQRAGNGWNLLAGDVADYVTGLNVSAGYFETLGVAPLVGRGFTRVETEPKGPRAVVISEGLWRRVFGARPDAIGERVRLSGVAYTLVGVMPDGFRTIPEAEVWTPLITSTTDNGFNYRILARVASDATLEQARQEFGQLRGEIMREFPRLPDRRLAATTWTPLREVIGAPVRTPLLILLGAVGFVLLIACVNVASLQLTRVVGRRRDLATRAALGGSRVRLARQVVAESLVLGLAGATAGLAVALVTARSILWLVSADAAQLILSGEALGIDWRVFGFTLGGALLCSVVFGVVPALLSTRVDVRAALAEGATTASRRTAWMRSALATAEVGLAIVLLVGAGLLLRTLFNLTSADTGFISSNVVVGRMSLQGATGDGGELESLLDRGLARVRGVPGVVAAAASNGVPVERPFNIVVEPPSGSLISEPRAIDWRYVTADYFRLFGIRPLEGRVFDERDHARAEPVAIVNEAFARAFFGRVNVLGETVAIVAGFQDPPRRIVGVVGNTRAASGTNWTRGLTALGRDMAPMLFTPAGQTSGTLVRGTHGAFAMTWSIRTEAPQPGLERDVQEALRAVDATLPFVSFEPMDAVIARDVDLPRLMAGLLAAFAGLAVLLAAVGLYGLISYSSSQRIREIGVRIAVGATTLRVLRQFLKEGLAITSIGLLAGGIGSVLSTDLLTAYLFGVDPLDWSTFAIVALLMLTTALLACLVPAVRAAHINPVRALRTE